MANKNVKIVFDIDNKDLEIVSKSVLSVTQQIRILQKELQSGNLTAEEFAIAANKVNGFKDQVAGASARGRELFGTLSLIPGPIGQIASKIDGTISLLKTFSEFKLSDLKNQITGFISDAGGIVQALGKATGITKVYTTLNNALAQSFVKVGVGEATATAGAKAFSLALTATGVGALLLLLGAAVSSFMEYADSTDEATIAQDKFNASIERTRQILDLDLASAKRRQAEGIANLKLSGASEKQIREQGIKDLKETLKLTKNALAEAAADENEIMKTGNGDLKKAQDARLGYERQVNDLESQIRVANIENQIATNKEAEQARKTNLANQKKSAEDKKQLDAKTLKETKDDLDAAIQLEINKGNTNAKVLEGLLAKRLALEGLKGNALELAQQKNAKIVREAVTEDKKANDEIIKNTQDFNRKIEDVQIAAIADDEERAIKARELKLKRDLEDLEKDEEFIKFSEDRKKEIRTSYETLAEADIRKIREEANNKELSEQDKNYEKQLRALEVRGQGLIQGTKSYYENKFEILKTMEQKELSELDLQYATGLLSFEAYYKKRKEIEEKYTQATKDLSDQRWQAQLKEVGMILNALSSISDALAANLDEEAKNSKEAFEKRKKFQVASAVIQGAAGILNIIATPPPLGMDFVVAAVLKGLQIAAVIGTTAAQISKIKSATFDDKSSENKGRRKLAEGGYVSGAGTSTSDSIPASLSNGEFVMNARSTAAFLPMLNVMNAAGNQPRFAMGGMISDVSEITNRSLTDVISTSLADRPIKTYVVSTDMSNQQQFDRAIKSRSTI
jgi:hypothetical protein